MSKNLLVLGATGGTGREVVSQALAAGHNVTALVRDLRQLPIESDRLQVVQGDVTSAAPTLSDVVLGQDAVISALGRGQSFEPKRLIEQSLPLIVAAMTRQGVTRLIHMSAFGIGETYADLPLFPRLFVNTLLRKIYRDKTLGEACVHTCDLEWTVVYPAGLTNGPRTGRYRVGEHLDLRGFPTVSRADVAEFLLSQVTDRTYLRKGVMVAD
jgi:putative NADH-flavin reductase